MRHCFTVLFSLIFIVPPGLAEPLLQQGNLDNWSAYKIKGESIYEPIMDMEQGVVIRASSTNSASGYRYFHQIDLLGSPILQWQWTAQQLPFFVEMNDQGIEKTITEFDETKDSGDDFVLRIVVGRQALFGDAKTLSYVWSGNQPIGSHWAPNRHSRVLVVSGESQVKMQWQTLARNVQHDWLDLFGEKIDSLDFIGFITDSDAIKGEAIGYYGGISVLPEAVLSAQALQ